ncbi:hypothetical protein BXQ27_32510, partial [Klebsiella aerogenes]
CKPLSMRIIASINRLALRKCFAIQNSVRHLIAFTATLQQRLNHTAKIVERIALINVQTFQREILLIIEQSEFSARVIS